MEKNRSRVQDSERVAEPMFMMETFFAGNFVPDKLKTKSANLRFTVTSKQSHC